MLPGTSIGSTPMSGGGRRARRRARSAGMNGQGLPEDIALGTRIQEQALDRAENARRERLNELAGMGAEQGAEARSDYERLASMMMDIPSQARTRQADFAARLSGQAAPAPAGGSPLDQRLAAVGARRQDAVAQQGGLQLSNVEQAAALQRLLGQIGNAQTDRARQFDNRSNLNQAADANDQFNIKGELSLGELLRQTGLGKRQASVTAGAGQAEREQMRLQADREEALYQRQIQLQQQQLEAQRQQDQMILGQIDGFLSSLRIR